MARHGRNPTPPPADPVDLASQLEPWAHPQFLPGNPHRIPPPNQRVRFPVSPLIGSQFADGSLSPPPPVLGSFPTADTNASVDPHHYASVLSLYSPVPTVSPSVPFLTQPASKRNLLILRNDSAAANIYIDFGKSASAQSTLKITPGQTFLFDEVVPQDDLYYFADAAAGFLAYSYSNIA